MNGITCNDLPTFIFIYFAFFYFIKIWRDSSFKTRISLMFTGPVGPVIVVFCGSFERSGPQVRVVKKNKRKVLCGCLGCNKDRVQ